jgi:hypothetical protein
MEGLLLRAWRERILVTVTVLESRPRKPVSIILRQSY